MGIKVYYTSSYTYISMILVHSTTQHSLHPLTSSLSAQDYQQSLQILSLLNLSTASLHTLITP